MKFYQYLIEPNTWNLLAFFGPIFLGTLFTLIYFKYNKSRPLLNSLPGLFTSIGLLGTFCAICESLGELNVNNASNIGKTLAEAQNNSINITQIISDIIPAFTSSIWGLIFAFLITIITKIIYLKEDKKQDDKINFESPEDLLFSINNHLFDMNKLLVSESSKSKEYNEKLNETLGNQSSILKTFVEDFVKRMDGIFERMNGAIEAQIHAFGEEQFNKSSEVVNDISSRFTELSKDIISKQSESVDSMMQKTNAELSLVSGNITSLVTKLCEQTTDALDKLNQNQMSEYEKIQENNRNFADSSINSFKEISATIKQTNSELLDSSIEMNKNISDEIRSNLGSYVETMKNAIDIQSNDLMSAIKTNVDSLKVSYEFIKDHLAHIVENYNQSAKAYDDAVTLAHRTNEASEKALSKIDETMDLVGLSTEKASKAIDVFDSRYDNMEDLISQIHTMSSAIESLQNLEILLNKISKKWED